MVKLEIVDRQDYTYTLKSNKGKEYTFNLEFIDVCDALNVGDYIYMKEELLNPKYVGYSVMYTFGDLESKYGKPNISKNDIDVIMLEMGTKLVYAKRLYG